MAIEEMAIESLIKETCDRCGATRVVPEKGYESELAFFENSTESMGWEDDTIGLCRCCVADFKLFMQQLKPKTKGKKE